MVPDSIHCDDCGRPAKVRSAGRIQYDWPKTHNDDRVATIPTIKMMRLTVDCPRCGVKQQDFWPNNLEMPNADW